METNSQTGSQERFSLPEHPGRDAICIIGMHRSGTSMIANLLRQCGLYLGPADQLLGANSGNADGHFEHKGFIQINDALLRRLGGSWEFPPQLEGTWHARNDLRSLRADAENLVGSLAQHSPWGWKDPRTTVLLPFWRSIVPRLRFIICVRSPLEVAKSLAKRNKIPVEQGMLLWQRYVRAALAETEESPRMLCHYEDFLIDPEIEADRLVSFCGLQKPAHVSLVENGVRPELRHQKSGLAEILGLQSVPAQHKFLYLGLRGLAREERMGGHSTRAAGELLRLLDDFYKQDRLAQLEAQLAEAKNEAAKLRADIMNDLKANHRWAYRVYRNFIKPFRVR